MFQFKYATPLDTFLIIFGLLVSLAMGAAMPILCILFGDTLQVKETRFLKCLISVCTKCSQFERIVCQLLIVGNKPSTCLWPL